MGREVGWMLTDGVCEYWVWFRDVIVPICREGRGGGDGRQSAPRRGHAVEERRNQNCPMSL